MLGHEAPVLSIAITPDGERFATGGAGQIVFWSLAEGRPLRTLRGHKGPVWSVAFTPGGDQLFSAGRDGRVIRWDLETGSQIESGIRRMIRLMCLPVIYWRSGGRNSSEPVRSVTP